MKILQNNELGEEIRSYWTERAKGYSEYNQQEMADARRIMWKSRKPSEIRILDAGTGPGFFAILLAESGYQVTAVDATEEMLKEAKRNAGDLAGNIVWKTEDVQELREESNFFDAVVTRNVTWNLPDPAQAYREWYRVLKKGGVLYNFDADWYGHLFDKEKRSGYEQDRRQVEEKEFEDYYEGTDIERMENIARQVPLSRLERPRWDIEAMKKTEEIANNGSTPVFLLSGEK